MFAPRYPGVGGVSGNDLSHLSSAALKFVRVGIDLMCAGTALKRAGATDEKELNIIVLMLEYFEFPKGRMQDVPLLADSLKEMFNLFIAVWN